MLKAGTYKPLAYVFYMRAAGYDMKEEFTDPDYDCEKKTIKVKWDEKQLEHRIMNLCQAADICWSTTENKSLLGRTAQGYKH